MVKNCDLGLENAALGLRPRAVFSRPRSQFFTIRTSQPANNIYIFTKYIFKILEYIQVFKAFLNPDCSRLLNVRWLPCIRSSDQNHNYMIKN